MLQPGERHLTTYMVGMLSDTAILAAGMQHNKTHNRNKILLNVACCLLHITTCSLRKYKQTLTRFLLTATKAVIPRHWRNTTTPTTKEWLEEAHLLYKMEEIRAIAHEKTENLNKTWQP